MKARPERDRQRSGRGRMDDMDCMDCMDEAPKPRSSAPRALAGRFALVGTMAAFVGAVLAEPAYRVETIPPPEGIAPETGGIAFVPDGRLAVCFRRGEVFFFDPRSDAWSLPFAEGLHDPMGIAAGERPGELYVLQRPELTLLRDADGDGRADEYETVCDDWGMSGNYHELAFGPVRDAAGNFFVALGCASPNADPRLPVRGALSAAGRKGAMYSAVPWRGWTLKIAPDGTVEPFSSGFRTPNGLGFGPEGELFVADNQGDWVGSSALHHTTAGDFHGHPNSLAWKADFEGAPVDTPVATLDAMRKRPAVLFPQGDMANSPAEPLLDATGGKFGPFAGQMIVGETTKERLLRVRLEKVGGEWQGMCAPLLDGHGLRKGNNRLAFSPEGALYVGQTNRGWGQPAEGLQRVAWTGAIPFDAIGMSLTEDGFDLEFAKPVDPATASRPENWPIRRYRYLYRMEYGSPKVDEEGVRVVAAEPMGEPPTRVRLRLESLVPDRVYELRPRGVRSAAGEPIANPLLVYTANRLRGGE